MRSARWQCVRIEQLLLLSQQAIGYQSAKVTFQNYPPGTLVNPDTEQIWTPVPFVPNGAANKGTPDPQVSCNQTTGICVPAKMIPPPGYSPVKNAVQWSLCGNGSFDEHELHPQGFTKGVMVGGIAGWKGVSLGVGLGALGGESRRLLRGVMLVRLGGHGRLSGRRHVRASILEGVAQWWI